MRTDLQKMDRILLVSPAATRWGQKAAYDYIHINPVKHRLAARVRDWPYPSFHRMVRLGIYPADWAGDVANEEGAFGERP